MAWHRVRLVARVGVVAAAILLPSSAPAQTSDLQSRLAEADRLAWLTNWYDALPIYAEAEQAASKVGNRRDAMYAKFGRLRGQMQILPLPDTSEQLAADLETPLAKQDRRLRLRGLTVKGACGKARVIWRRLDCLNSRTQRCSHVPRNHAWRGHRLTADYVVAAGPLGRWADANEVSQGAERSAYVTLLQLMHENMGSPTGREPYGDGALVVVRGRESRPHGEGGQVSVDQQHVRGTRDA